MKVTERSLSQAMKNLCGNSGNKKNMMMLASVYLTSLFFITYVSVFPQKIILNQKNIFVIYHRR